MSLSPSPTTLPRRPTTALAQKAELWWQFTVRAVELRHKGSHLGLLWSVMNPLLMLALYFTVFGFIFKNHFHVLPDEKPTDFALAIFLGLILFHSVAETMGAAPGFIIGNPNFVKKVVFPLEILPLANVSGYWFHLLISLGLLMIGTVTVGRGLPLEGLLWLPLILPPLFLFSVGLGWLLAAVGVFFRDISQVTAFAAQVLLYASAIFYSTTALGPDFWRFLRWNPILHTVDLARDALLWHVPVSLPHLGYTWVAGILMFFFGYAVFKRLQPAFADVI